MTADLARFDNNAVATLDGTTDALARLGQWVEAARHAHQLVAPLVDTAFVPDAYRPKVDPRATDKEKVEARAVAVANATAAVLQGLSLGIDPLVALQQIYIVHGRPGLYAKMMVALVQSHGHEVWTEDLSDGRAVVAGRRRGTEAIERVTVTMDQARKAGWTRNDNYAKTPQDMLWSRAAGRVCDRIASDVLKGIASVEEIQDQLADPGNGTRTVTPRRRAEPAVLPAAAPEPPLDVEPSPPPRGITTTQQRTLHALMKEHDLGDKVAGLAYLSDLLGRDLASTKDLTQAEAQLAIDSLRASAEEPPLDEAPVTQEPLGGDWPDTAQPGGGAPDAAS